MFSYFENRKTIKFYVLCLSFSIETKIKTLFLISYFNLSEKTNWHFGYTDSSQSRKWLAHLNTLEEIISYATGLSKIKYRRILSVYLSDIRASEERVPNIWQFVLDGHFSILLNRIPGTAKGVDHAGEREKNP